MRMVTKVAAVTGFAVALLQAIGPLRAQGTRPLPDQTTFLNEARKYLHRDRVLLSQYVYTEKRTRYDRDSHGAIVKQNIKVLEVHPSVEPDLTYERLLSVDDVPVDRRTLEKEDREQAEKQNTWAARLRNEGESAREKRARKRADADRDEQALVDEVFALYAIRMLGREIIDGRSTIALHLDPKPDYRPHTDEGKLLKKFRAQAWVTEDDFELAQLDVEAIDTVPLVMGFIARLAKGSRGLFHRRKVNGEIWLPVETRLTGSAKLLLVKTMKLEQVSEYSDYRKYGSVASIASNAFTSGQGMRAAGSRDMIGQEGASGYAHHHGQEAAGGRHRVPQVPGGDGALGGARILVAH